MLIISVLVVAMFIWLIFNHPFKEREVEDTYGYFLEKIKEKDRHGQV